jgi:hypothetical protein
LLHQELKAAWVPVVKTQLYGVLFVHLDQSHLLLNSLHGEIFIATTQPIDIRNCGTTDWIRW